MSDSPTRRIRTVLYDDQKFSATEIDLLHTPALQRLYDLHQLGLTDRVFIDASHSRLHHVVGVVEQTEKMMRSIETNLLKGANDDPLFYAGGPADGVSKKWLATHTHKKIPAVRLMALLHDITHAPYGHTLEDEIELVSQKHDDPTRQADSFYRLLLQYFAWIERNQTKTPWSVASRLAPRDNNNAGLLAWYLDCPDVNIPPVSDAFVEYLVKRWTPLLSVKSDKPKTLRRIPVRALRQFVKDLRFAIRALFHLDVAHRDLKDLEAGKGLIPKDRYPVDKLLDELISAATIPVEETDNFVPQRDVFLLDVLGNTICADLLDYARRDAAWAGLKLNYDADRISANMTVVTAQTTTPMAVKQPDGSSVAYPLADACLRTCVSLFSHKLRTDIPGELMSLLQVRYFVYERVLYHPTKCVAGAMLGAAIQLIGWRKMPINLQHVGDTVFLYEVTEAAKLVRDLLSTHERTAKFESTIADRLQKQIRSVPFGGIADCAASLLSDRLFTIADIREELKTSGRFRHDKAIAAKVEAHFKDKADDQTLEALLAELEKATPAAESQESRVLIWLNNHQPTVQTVIDEIVAGLRILDRLAARRYFKTTFRLLPNANVAGVNGIKASAVAEMFKKALPRKIAEREIERRASLPRGSVVIHCPPVKGPTKVAKILITNADVSNNKDRKIARLNEIGDIDRDVFTDHQNGVRALEKMYQSTWRFAVSVAPPFDADWPRINKVIGTVLRELLTTAGDTPLKNDGYTELELQHLEAQIAEIERAEAMEEKRDGHLSELPLKVGQRMLRTPQFSSLSADASNEEIERLIKRVIGPTLPAPVADRTITEAELADLMKQYLRFSKISDLEDASVRAVLRRIQRLKDTGLRVFHRDMEPHRSMAPIQANELKKQNIKQIVKNLNDAVTNAEEAQESSPQE